MDKTINILLCLDDIKWDYTRHCAVTLLSLLETNKKNRIKIYILSSILPEENIDELNRIVKLYNQEIDFIISDNIVPEKLKKVIINRRESVRWPWYRRFFPNIIKNIDRILYMDCDVLVTGDISTIYNMDMHGKAIAGYLDCFPFRCKNKLFHIKNYINSWVLLFDARKYDVHKVNVNKMQEINKKFSKYFHWWDQDKANIIFQDDVYVYKRCMNYQITSKFFNVWLDDAEIVHCLNKPYIQYSNIPKKLIKLYYHYLDMTKWKWYPEKKADYWYFKYIYMLIRNFCFHWLIYLLWDKLSERLFNKIWKIFL